ncbi:hypothetical protein DAMA08_037000 [Martiniozyma asiatica (nom. inval.)]|nr:hypothetical protein DAMA08_037000 [Martiniozyma asiatica]
MTSPLNFLPFATPSKSFWIEEGPSTLKSHRTTPKLPVEADVVIVGAGLSGTSVAHNLLYSKDKKFKGSILMLDARDVSSCASGRNGGHIRSYYHEHQHYFNQNYSQEIAAEIAIYEHNEKEKIKSLVNELGIDCNYEDRSACQTYDEPDTLPERLRDFYCYQSNPFIPESIKKQVTIHWVTSVTRVKGLDEIKWIVDTPRGKVITSHVVFATNAYTKSILPEFRDHILPVKGVVSHFKTPNQLPHNYYHTRTIESDYVTSQPGSIIAGGGKSTYLHYPTSLKMINSIDDGFVPSEAKEYFNGYVERNYKLFSQKNGGEFPCDYIWSGVMAYTDDDFPFVGSLENLGRDGCFILAGFTGHGMPRIWSCGEYIAQLVSGNTNDTEIVKIPQVFKLGMRMLGPQVGFLKDVEAFDWKNKGKFKL